MYNNKQHDKTPMVDEFAIYERKLEASEINEHHRNCILPPLHSGWNKKISHSNYEYMSRFKNPNDSVTNLNMGSVKGYSTLEESGVKYFEMNISSDVLIPEYGKPSLDGTGFAVGVSDKDANEGGLLYITPQRQYPCFENHIMLWMKPQLGYQENSETETEEFFLSAALYGVYEYIPLDRTIKSYLGSLMSDYNFSVTFTIAVDYEQKYVLFYANGRIVYVYQIPTSNIPKFYPTYSSDLTFSEIGV